jgi:hypothetical protein
MKEMDIDSGVSWRNQNLNTTTSSTLKRTVTEGDFVTLWVRARDIMGNRKLSSLQLGFDASAPSVFDLNFMRNTGSRFTYGSK